MKQLILLAAAVIGVTFTSCKKESGNGRLDPNAKVALNPAPGTVLGSVASSKAYDPENPEHLTARQIVEKADELISNDWTAGIGDWQRDFDNNRIVMSSTWVVAQNGTLETVSLKARDHILVTHDQELNPVDTIAYIPNSVMESLEVQITAAYEAEDYATCYRLFEDGFVFTPITGTEWLELKAAGQN